jgi:hypothetical protein
MPLRKGKILALQGVARHGDDEQPDARADERHEDGHHVGADQLIGRAEK